MLTIFRPRIMLRAIYCLWYVVELNLINLLLLQASLIYTSVDSTSRRKSLSQDCLLYLHPRKEGCFTEAEWLKIFTLACQQVCLPRAVFTASMTLQWVRQPSRGCSPHPISSLRPGQRCFPQRADLFAGRGSNAERCSPAGMLVCCHGAAPLHRCHVCARRDVSCCGASSVQGMHRSRTLHKPCAGSAQPGGKPETAWPQRSHTEANNGELTAGWLFTYLFWMCQRGCQT